MTLCWKPLKCVAAATIAVCCLAPGSSAGQDLPPIAPDTRVRVWTLDGGAPFTGLLLAGDSTGVSLRGIGVVRRVPMDRLRRLDRSLGTSNRAVTGLLIGAGFGAAASVAFLASFCKDSDTVCETDEVFTALAYIGGPPTVVGLVIGLLVRRERWQTLYPSTRLSFVPPPGGGPGLGLRLRF